MRSIQSRRESRHEQEYVVELTKDQRGHLRKLISAGSAPARMLNSARILLKADLGEHSEGRALIDRQARIKLGRLYPSIEI